MFAAADSDTLFSSPFSQGLWTFQVLRLVQCVGVAEIYKWRSYAISSQEMNYSWTPLW